MLGGEMLWGGLLRHRGPPPGLPASVDRAKDVVEGGEALLGDLSLGRCPQGRHTTGPAPQSLSRRQRVRSDCATGPFHRLVRGSAMTLPSTER